MPIWLFYPLWAAALASGFAFYRSGDTVAAVTVIGIAMFGWSGFKMGLGRIVATVVAFILAVAIAPWIGLRYEDQFSAQFGTTGLTNRLLCIGSIGLMISLIVTLVISLSSGMVLAKRRKLNVLNSYCGFTIGLVEGGAIALLICGGLMSVQQWQRGDNQTPNRIAVAIDHWASETRQSAFGPIAKKYNPFERVEALKQVGSYRETVRQLSDPAKMEQLLHHPKIAELRDDPQIQSAIEELQQDPDFKEIIAQGRPLDRESLVRLMSSQTVLRLIDQKDFTERAQSVLQDIR
ncbi:hypothetical protein NHH03_24950 [Stieleria sp. TO1_6]|uniref:hypothetical protein n=1 Tax=Stieleria tagensis TaxID=2956795 RepID=UPI00209B96BB|nr:hypothetical protein [Stieleria tagensis]MCO8125009.1 hypothetical protein [Stieleria tagensis]